MAMSKRSRRVGPPPAILIAVLLSSCSLLLLSFVPLALLWVADEPVPDLVARGAAAASDDVDVVAVAEELQQPQGQSISRPSGTSKVREGVAGNPSASTKRKKHCTAPIVSVKGELDKYLRNGNFYDLRDVGKSLPEDVATSTVFLVIQFSAAPTTGQQFNITMDILRSDWTGAFDLVLFTHDGGKLMGDKYVAIAFNMHIHDTTSTPLWMAVYGMKEAGLQANVQLVYESSSSQNSSCLAGVVRALQEWPEHVINIGAEHFGEPRRIPYHRIATAKFDSPKVTMCTQMTINRLPRLDAMAQNWAGPLSAVIYVGYRAKVEEEMAVLTSYWDESPALQNYVDLHIVIDGKKPWYRWENMDADPYPVNLLRQLSVDYANRTDYVMYVEGDMVSLRQGHAIVTSTWNDLLAADNPDSGMPAAFAVPIYFLDDCPKEKPECAENFDPHEIARDLAQRVPKSKADLVQGVTNNRQHGVTRMNLIYFDYEGWEAADGTRSTDLFLPYDGKEPSFKYVPPKERHGGKGKLYSRKMNSQEPYIIIKKDGMPPYDVLYWSLKGDKRTQVFDVVEKGYRFLIHRDIFLVNYADTQLRGKNNGGRLRWDWIPMSKDISWRRDFIVRVHKVMTGHHGMT